LAGSIPADWFYVWQKIDAKTKQPYAIGLQDRSPFAFAGLWETWKDKAKGETKDTYTIVTTDPNELMQTIYDRMPVILNQQDYERWLDPGDTSQLPVDLMRPYDVEEMKAWKVSRDVGNVRNNRPELAEPIFSELHGSLCFQPRLRI
jgi:putative SOS response-associated peptidase YedK